VIGTQRKVNRMTDREKAIVMAHTGICMLEGEKLGVFYQYLNELYGRPVYTHEWMILNIKEKSKPDFLQLCKEEEPERKKGMWIDMAYAPNGLFYATCSVCGKRQTTEATNYCGNCGARLVK